MTKAKLPGAHLHTVDTGWAWLVAAAACFSLFFTCGFAYSTGVYYVTFLDTFQESKGVTAWISSLNFGVLCAVGPVASLLINTVSCRFTSFIGGFISSLGLFLSAFATSITMLSFTFGVLTGAGFGLVFTTCVVVISEYFVKYRVVAMGLSISGTGLGTIAYPWLSRWLIGHYAWRGALLITAAINLHVCVASLLMRPNRLHKSKTVILDYKISTQKEILKSDLKLHIQKEVKKAENDPPTNVQNNELLIKNNAQNNDPLIKNNVQNNDPVMKNNVQNSDNDPLTKKEVRKGHDEEGEGRRKCEEEKRGESGTRTRSVSESCKVNVGLMSSRSLALVSSQSLGIVSSRSLPVVSSRSIMSSGTQPGCLPFQLTMTDLGLDIFRQTTFLLLCGNTLLFCFGMSVMYTHISAYAASLSMQQSARTLLISSIGFSNLIGRVLLGISAQFLPMDTTLLFMLSYFLAGLGTLLCAVWTTFEGLLVCVCTFGFFSAGFGPLLSEVTCLAVGVMKFSMAYGYLMVFMAVGTMIGAPLAGMLYDGTLQYKYSFYLGGSSLLLSAIIMLPDILPSRWKTRNYKAAKSGEVMAADTDGDV